ARDQTRREGPILAESPVAIKAGRRPARPAITMTPQPPQHPSRPEPPLAETDPRFPSGPWRGFFLMHHWPGRHQMELLLSFRRGVMTGEGRDLIGPFLIRGKYNLKDGKC